MIDATRNAAAPVQDAVSTMSVVFCSSVAFNLPRTQDAASGASAALRKHAGHRQSPPAAGIGSRTVSALHQQSPPRSQENAVPQRSQTRRRTGKALANGFVMSRVKLSPGSSGPVHGRGAWWPHAGQFDALGTTLIVRSRDI
jgi:hypothetical protein